MASSPGGIGDIYSLIRGRIEQVDADLRVAGEGKSAEGIAAAAERAFGEAAAAFSASALQEYALAVASGEPYELFI
jgi:hypothetical protein